MDTRTKRTARELLALAYDASPQPTVPRTRPSAHPSAWFDATVIVLCAVLAVGSFFG